jgi:predicted dehydrogenase
MGVKRFSLAGQGRRLRIFPDCRTRRIFYHPTSMASLSFPSHLTPLPQDRSIGIGCIGSGFIMADCHLVAYRAAGLNPVAITSQTKANAAAVANRHQIPHVTDSVAALLERKDISVIDIAVPPDQQAPIIQAALRHSHIRGILAQKPLGVNFDQSKALVADCAAAGVTLAVNQNMRHDHSIRACKNLLAQQALGDPVLGTLEMRAIPHWMPWQQRLGWVTLRIMSIHHLDAMRFLFGNPTRVFASIRPDPRTKFPHEDGIALMILEYASGLRLQICDDVWAGPAREGAAADLGIRWRIEGTTGMAKGTIGWPSYPERTPSTMDFTTIDSGIWKSSTWSEVWFPDAFIGPMADLLCAMEEGREPETSGRENLGTMALVDACYRSVHEHRAVALSEFDF